MPVLRRLERFAPLIGLLVGACILLVGIGRHGIWDPTELAFAESLTGAHRSEGMPYFHGRLVRAGFELFGRRDFSGRIFGAAATLLAAVAAMGLTRRHLDARASAYAAIAAAATPLAVLNARWMVGDGAAIGLHSLVGLGLFIAAFDRTSEGVITETRTGIRAFGVALAIGAAVLATMFRGALLGVLPPLLALAGVAIIEPVRSTAGRMRLVLGAVGLALAVTIAVLVFRDAAVFSVLLGGVPGGEAPPSFDRYLQVAFHTLAPLSPVFVLGAARAVRSDSSDEVGAEKQRFTIALVLWACFAYGACTLFAARYGHPTFLAVVPVAVIAAITLREAETHRTLDLASIVVFVMLLGLVLRDYALYPASPLAGVPVSAPTLAADFQPRKIWAALFVLFGATFSLGAASHLVDGRDWRAVLSPLRSAYDWLFSTKSGLATAVLLLLIELALVVLGAFGPALHLSSIVSRIARPIAVALPLAPPLLTALALLALHAFSRLGTARLVPAVVTIAAIGAYVQGPFLVDLSGDLSPRELFATYNELHGRGETLAQFDIRSHAIDYYVDGPAEVLENRAEVVQRLSAGATSRTWVMFRRALLPELDRDVRTRTGRHLFLAHGSNEDFVLATNRPIANRRDENPLSLAIVAPTRARPQHPLSVRFRDVELIGYDLDLPNGSSVGAGQSFRITWYWKSTQRTSLDWRIFVHIDGSGLRLNGDHDPVEGLLPTTQWVVGDVIRDTQELEVPSSYPSDDFRILVGFFAGAERMPILEGPNGGENRAIAGTLRVR